MSKVLSSPAGEAAPKTSKPCPICGKPGVAQFRPFCSSRCADVDLNRWFSGNYAIPVAPAEEDEDTRPGGAES